MTKLAQEYKIEEAIITADRLGAEYDIRRYILQADFFEDLTRPYVTGQIVFMDDIGLVQEIGIKGTETIKITISTAEEFATKASWTMEFNIVSIVQKQKATDYTELYHINLISPHAFRDQNIKISRSYTGRLTKICEAILKNHLDVDVDPSYAGGLTEAQDPVKIITPYISPLESVQWLIDRASTEVGAPFYAYQTLYDQEGGRDKIRIGNLETMMKAPAFNEDKHMVYGAARGMAVAGADVTAQDVLVKSLTAHNIEETLKLCQEGALGANLIQLDTFTSQRFERHFDATRLLDKLADKEIIKGRENQNVYDEEQKLTFAGEEKTLNECDARYVTSINSFGTYGTTNGYADVQDQFQAMNKIRTGAVKSLLNRNMIDIVIPGITFFEAKGAGGNSLVSVGDVIWVDFLQSNTDKTEGELNEEMSGLYLIHKCRNSYKDTTHEIAMSISKLSKNTA